MDSIIIRHYISPLMSHPEKDHSLGDGKSSQPSNHQHTGRNTQTHLVTQHPLELETRISRDFQLSTTNSQLIRLEHGS